MILSLNGFLQWGYALAGSLKWWIRPIGLNPPYTFQDGFDLAGDALPYVKIAGGMDKFPFAHTDPPRVQEAVYCRRTPMPPSGKFIVQMLFLVEC